MDENKGVKIGIVIPIYNVAKYLVECLESVANQTYGDFCAVLVNDGSTDDSLKIELDFIAKDSRFVLFDKENGGLSSARNVGIAWFSGNLFWGMQFTPFSHKTALNGRPSPISLVSRENGAKPHRHYFDCRLSQNPYDSLLFLSLQESA